MLTLKRLNVPLDRDVIFLAESGEEGQVEWGIQYMVENHWSEIQAEFAIAEAGNAVRKGGKERSVNVMTAEKSAYPVQLLVKGTAGHGSVPLPDNAIGRLSQAVARVYQWQPPMRLNDTTERTSSASPPSARPPKPHATTDFSTLRNQQKSRSTIRLHEPNPQLHAAKPLSPPNMFAGGYRVNVIPSTATATLDIRALPD